MSETNEVLSADLSEIRKILADNVKLRSGVIKPLENAVRALKDSQKHSVALAEAVAVLEKPSPELSLPRPTISAPFCKESDAETDALNAQTSRVFIETGRKNRFLKYSFVPQKVPIRKRSNYCVPLII